MPDPLYILIRLYSYLSQTINRGSYTSAHILLNLLNELGKRDIAFHNEFYKFNNTRARMLDSIHHNNYYDIKFTLKSHCLT